MPSATSEDLLRTPLGGKTAALPFPRTLSLLLQGRATASSPLLLLWWWSSQASSFRASCSTGLASPALLHCCHSVSRSLPGALFSGAAGHSPTTAHPRPTRSLLLHSRRCKSLRFLPFLLWSPLTLKHCFCFRRPGRSLQPPSSSLYTSRFPR